MMKHGEAELRALMRRANEKGLDIKLIVCTRRGIAHEWTRESPHEDLLDLVVKLTPEETYWV